jgi:uncharacterized cupin superfamily protein
MSKQKSYVVRARAIEDGIIDFSHPWNEKSLVRGTQLGPLVGLERVGVSYARIPPGYESFVYHSHAREEEWIYILSGRGVAEVDGETYEVHAGDFLGFPTPDVAHHLTNPFDEDLVYLMGGERERVEVADFPRLGRRMVRLGDEVEIYDKRSARPFGPLDED